MVVVLREEFFQEVTFLLKSAEVETSVHAEGKATVKVIKVREETVSV